MMHQDLLVEFPLFLVSQAIWLIIQDSD